MPHTGVEKKAELLRAASARAHGEGDRSGPPTDSLDRLLESYYRHVAPEDIVDRSADDVYGAFAAHLALAAHRPQGTTAVTVFTPAPQQGWSAEGRSVVEVVTDDMPFLVDSVTQRLSALDHEVHVVVHPQYDVRRSITGELQEITSVEENTPVPDDREDVLRESWMHIEIDRLTAAEDASAIEQSLQQVLRDVREAVEDWPKMQQRMQDLCAEVEAGIPGVDPGETDQSGRLLRWLVQDHFTFLGFREYDLHREAEGEVLAAVPGSGLGILRNDPDLTRTAPLTGLRAVRAREPHPLVLAKANSRSTVHRNAYLDYVGVKRFDAEGRVVGERRFLGLYSAAAYTESILQIPMVAEKAAAVLARAGFDPESHDGKALLAVLENYPREELFLTPVDELADIIETVLYTRERRQLRVFVRRDGYGRYYSCLVYLPRDRYNTTVRIRFAEILRERLGGEQVEWNARINESPMARLHFVVRPPEGGEIAAEVHTEDLERRLAEAARSWRDELSAAAVATFGEDRGIGLGRAYGSSLPEAYKEDFSPRTGAEDLGVLDDLRQRLADRDADRDTAGDTAPDTAPAPLEGIELAWSERPHAEAAGTHEARLKIFRIGTPLSLSALLPVLSSLGVEVVDERPYELEGLEFPARIYEFGLRSAYAFPENARALFEAALHAIWDGANEADGFNALVLRAGLDWRQACLLRAYAKYFHQGGTPFAQDYIETALWDNVDLTRLLIDYFWARFEPGLRGREERVAQVLERFEKAMGDVVSLDHDRILRSYQQAIAATLRTNFFQRTAAGELKAYLSLKLDPAGVPDLPEPRPRFEIFVYSPRVEGVHLRFGAVARGGLRWSDRRDDFRTEILGLVKAQMVKNTVIVPVGAKGGFFCKQLPDPGDREAWMAEGIACYRMFISGLLDVTDNLHEGVVVPPADVVRHDGDDSYLVVAADKGTATFSDIANAISAEYGFWLGDAFASGGSVGYDHKAMGITARGAWVSVQRHFQEMGVDTQREDFTCVGIGDMSGDVFGNGMLCSEHIRLVAAFDHRDIFLDPDPDAATGYAERSRLFALPRSSWKDYDTALLSPGGGVFPRTAKSIPLNDAIRSSLGIEESVAAMTPAELIQAILTAPVDLLWNGGIGTYVKSSDQTHAQAGDKSNDAIRVDGRDLRVRCVGEGGNLGLTQLGRIEYARNGGRINTDFIDNSAGVDTSDREVNIKILLDRVVADGGLSAEGRNTLLASMTDEVAALVLRDNDEQNLALANAEANAAPMLHVHEDLIRSLERSGVLHRELEGLPTSREVRRMIEHGQGLTRPELAVLLSWTKIVLADELIASSLPDDPFLRSDLIAYFPSLMRQDHRGQMVEHPLRREIVVTQVVNDLVNGAGFTFWHRLGAETGATAAELTLANFVAREIFGCLALREQIDALSHAVSADVQTRMRIEVRTLVERATRWLLTNRRPPMDSEAVVDAFSVPIQRLMAELPQMLTGIEHAAYAQRRRELVEAGVPEELASAVAALPPAYMLLGVLEAAERLGIDPAQAARVHFELGERLGVSRLLGLILSLERRDRWQAMSRAAMRDDLLAVHTGLTTQVLQRASATDDAASAEGAGPEPGAAAAVDHWYALEGSRVERARETLAEICAEDAQADLARISVGLRVLRGLTAGS